MPIPTLTWSRSNGTPMAGAGARLTAQEFIASLASVVDASTHWKQVNSWDGANSRGWIEIAPKSTTAGIKEGRLLIAVKTADATNVPSIAARLAPWSTHSGAIISDCFVGFSPDADSTGPAVDPITATTSADIYPSKTFSGLVSVQCGEISGAGVAFPVSGQTIWRIESAEVLTLAWSVATGSINFIQVGKALERPDGEDSYWSMIFSGACAVLSAGSNPWNALPSNQLNPIADSYLQHSAGSTTRHVGLAYLPAFGGSYALYGAGKTDFSANVSANGSYTSSEFAVLKGVTLAGGPYFSGGSDQLLGFWRQVRWGPAALRSQRLVDGVGVTQALYLHYNGAAMGSWGLWFDNVR